MGKGNHAAPLQVVHFESMPGLGHYSIQRSFSMIRDAMPGDVQCVSKPCRYPNVGLLPRLRNMMQARKAGGQVNHVTGDVHFLTLALPRQGSVLTIHDCEILHRLSGWRRWLVCWWWFRAPAARAQILTTVSENAAEELGALLGEQVRSKLRVIPACLDPGFEAVPAAVFRDRPRILAFGGAPNKNVIRLAAALEGINCELVLVGLPRPEHEQAMARHGISCRMVAGLSDDEMRACYADCDLLAFPSTGEGFGMPIIEAQAVGRPVVTSNRSPMREVAGEAGAVRVDPDDVQSIRGGIVRVMEDAALRERLMAAGAENAKRFSVEQTAQQYAAVYREVAGRV